MSLLFCTGNSQKFSKARAVCEAAGIKLEQAANEVDEVQSEDAEYVALQKARAVFELIGKPFLISDDSWSFEGLKGFPGTYAKSVNTWFTPDDYIRLTRDLKNRKASLTQKVVYKDVETEKIFSVTTEGTILKEARGSSGISIQKVVSLETDGSNKSISEVMGDRNHYPGKSTMRVWHHFADWYSSYK